MSLLLLLTLSLASSTAASGAIDTVALKEICGKTQDPGSCVSSVQSVASKETVTATNATTVLKLAIKAAIKETKASINKIKAAAHDAKHEKQTNYLLRSCVEDFKVSIDDLEDAQLAMAKDDSIAKRRIRQANGMCGVCQNGFEAFDVKTSPIHEEVEAIRKSTAILMEIANIVWPGVAA